MTSQSRGLWVEKPYGRGSSGPDWPRETGADRRLRKSELFANGFFSSVARRTGNGLLDQHASLQVRSLLNGYTLCTDIAHKDSRLLQLNTLDTVQVSVHSPLNHDIAGPQAGADPPIR